MESSDSRLLKTVEFRDLVYSTHTGRSLHLDLFVPDGDHAVPLLIYFPIGGMRVCSWKQPVPWIVTQGFALASIEIRVSSEAIAPAQVHDCKAAIRWLRAHAETYGFDASRIGVWGHSAGGLLASLMGTSGDILQLEGPDNGCPVSTRVQAVCDECGAPHDIAYFAKPEVRGKYSPVYENLKLYLGDDITNRLDLARLVSPQTYISESCPPFLLLHGDNDNVVPLEETVRFHHALCNAGVDSTLSVLKGIGHGWEPILTRDRILSFFRRVLS